MPPKVSIPKSVTEIVRRELALRLDVTKYKIFFFGSRAKGKAGTGADIDIGILGDQPLSPRLLAELRDAYEESETIHTIDCVDLAAATEDFRRAVLSGPIVPVF